MIDLKEIHVEVFVEQMKSNFDELLEVAKASVDQLEQTETLNKSLTAKLAKNDILHTKLMERIDVEVAANKEMVEALEKTLLAIENHNEIQGNAYGHYHDVLANGKLLIAKYKEVLE